MTAEPLTLTRPATPRTRMFNKRPPTPEEQTAAEKQREAAAAAAFVRSIVTALTEVEYGVRTLQSIERWLDPEVRSSVVSALRMRRTLRSEQQADYIRGIGRPRLSSPAPNVIEAAVSIALRPRTKACALRLEKNRDRWIVREYLTA